MEEEVKTRIFILLIIILANVRPAQARGDLEVEVLIQSFLDPNRNCILDEGEGSISMKIRAIKDGEEEIFQTGTDGTLILTFQVSHYYEESVTVIALLPVAWDSVCPAEYVIPLTYMTYRVVFGMFPVNTLYFPVISKCPCGQMYLGITVGVDDAVRRWPFEPEEEVIIHHLNDDESLPNGTYVHVWGPLSQVTIQWGEESKDIGWSEHLDMHDSWFKLTPEPIQLPDGSWLLKGGVEYFIIHSICGRYVKYTVKWGPPVR